MTSNPTPYSLALVCIGQYARQYNLRAPRIAIGRIGDYKTDMQAQPIASAIRVGRKMESCVMSGLVQALPASGR